MKLLVRGLFAFSLALVLSTFVSAEEKKKVDKKEAPKPAVNPLFTFNKAMKPAATEEQGKKLAELQKEYAPQVSELQKKLSVIMTPERVKARNEAVKKAQADKLKGKEFQEAINAAVKLTDDERKQMGDLQKQNGALVAEINKKKTALLTEEQIASLKAPPKKPEPKKPDAKKPDAKKPDAKKESK